jgi:dephospho-CoA kinase
MLRVGLTGSLGSGKSTAAHIFFARGAHLVNADEISRGLMQPGQPVYDAIVARFGPRILLFDKKLDRPAIARIVFSDKAALADLNAIVHPATIARQAELLVGIAATDPHGVAIIESALIFETTHNGPDGWRSRFDRIILVTAPEADRIARFIERTHPNPTPAERSALEAEARRRLAQQLPEEKKADLADYILTNDGNLAHFEAQVDRLWPDLQRAARTNV